jgi:hypothetical protein
MSLEGKNVVLTGFRDKKLQEQIEAKGGRVVSAVSGTCDFLVMVGSRAVESSKTKKAQEVGATVMSRIDFEAKFFAPSLLTRLFGTTRESISSAEKCYITLDNGGQSFKVCFNTRRFWVFKPKNKNADKLVYDNFVVKPTSYSEVFVGKSPKNKMTLFSGGHGPRFDGNSMLFELKKHTYMYIGEVVSTFTIPDTIESYVSPVGNSGVPYPYAVGTQNTYLLKENMFVPNSMRTTEDPNEQVHGLTMNQARTLKKLHHLRTKKIQGRLW